MPWFDAAGPAAWILLLLVPGLLIAVFGLIQLLALPLAAGFELHAARRRRQEAPTLWDEWPSVSVIVAARDAAGVIGNCVRSIGRTRYSRYEVVLVDDGSADSTAELMASFAAADRRIKVLRQPRKGRAAARNLGARHATGEVLMFVDADATFSPRTVDAMLQAFEDQRTGAVCGEDTRRKRASGGPLVAMSELGTAITLRAVAAAGGLPLVPGGIEAFPGRILAELGPFREGEPGAELELAWRVRNAGYRVGFAPRATVRTASASTPRDLWVLRSRRACALLQGSRGVTGTPWPEFLLRHRWLVPFVPVCSLLTALTMLTGMARRVRGLPWRPEKQSPAAAGRTAPAGPASAGRTAPAGPASAGPAARPRDGDDSDDAWRALREAWA